MNKMSRMNRMSGWRTVHATLFVSGKGVRIDRVGRKERAAKHLLVFFALLFFAAYGWNHSC